ncbi:MAG: hypothetical protein Q8941_01000 [Bacteroidota bacterium]|nr:hypothetical protein [Bacteroidota bacterium]
MRKQLLLAPAFLVIAFAVVTGCGKDKTSAPAKTKTDLLCQSSWKFDHATAGGVDISSSINACLKDNIATFSSNKNVVLDEGTNVCSTSYAGTYTWDLQSSETILHISGIIFPGGSNDFTLVSLTETNLVVSQVMTISPFPPTTVEVTFKH